MNRTAISLGLQEVPSTPQAPGTDEEAGADDEKRSAYDEVLSMIRKLIDATFAEGQAFRASNDFEDACRKLLGTHGYPIYTADYLAQSLEKIAYTVSEDDSDSARIFELWKEWKNTTLEPNALQVPEEPDVTMAEASEGGEGKPEAPKWTEEGEYGERTKQLCKDENSFKIRYDASQRVLDIYILAKPQIKISEKRTSGLNLPEEIDAHYLETMDALQAVEQYAKDGPPVLLKRSLRRCLTTTQKDIRKQRYGLVVSLAPDSLRMQYKRDSEDWFFRPAETFFDENNRALSIWTVHKRLRRKRNARFVRWLSELETKSQYPAESNDALQKVLFGDQGTGFETRRELVINRASALKYAVYRTYRQDQVPRGPLRTFTLDDTDSLVIKLKKKVDRNDPYAQDESEDAMDVDLSAPQSPAAAKQPTAPKQQVIQRPQAGPKQSGMQQQQHQQQQQRKQPASSRKKAAAPVKAAPKLGPQLQTRITKASRRSRHVFKPPRRYMREGYDRKSKPPKRRDPGLLQLFAKPPKVRLTVEDRLSDRKTWNRHFIRVMTGMVKDRQIKLSSSDLQEEWHLDQLLMARGIHRAPGVFTAKFHEGRDSAGELTQFA